MSVGVAQIVVGIVEAYALAGFVFAMVFLPSAIARLDSRVAEAPKTMRLLILPGIVALWPLFTWRWILGTPEPIERNPHRLRAGGAGTIETRYGAEPH